MNLKKAIVNKRQAIDNARNVIIAAMVAASIVISLSLVGTNFLWNLRGFNNRVISEKESALDQLETNYQNIQELKESFNNLEVSPVNSQLVLDALPSKYDFPAFATSIEQLAITSGLIIDTISGDDNISIAPLSSKYPEPFELQLILEVEGPYEKVQTFIDVLDRSIRPIRIDRVELKGTDINMQFEITLVSYFQPPIDIEIEKETIR